MEDEDQLLLKWDDHHKSFFSLASELMDREELIDVTLLSGEASFPAHKLILSICSPYFRSLFHRNPCSHPMVVLKDVCPKYLRLLLLYMYEGEVACPSGDLTGLLATAKSLQIRGLLELEKKRRRGSSSTDDQTSSPGLLLNHNNNNHHSSHQFMGDEDIKVEDSTQPLDMQVTSHMMEDRVSSPLGKSSHSHPFHLLKGPGSNNGISNPPPPTMLPPNSLDPSDPMASMNALLAAAASQQVQQNSTTAKSNAAVGSSNNTSTTIHTEAVGSDEATGGPPSKKMSKPSSEPSKEINQAAAMANLQLYYYMQKVAGMGGGGGGPPPAPPASATNSPKERKECHVCGKTLYDRSTWNRHMRIHTGEKPYPCRFCGRRFRTNYNKLGHEKKCPDRHNGETAPIVPPQPSAPTTTEPTAPIPPAATSSNGNISPSEEPPHPTSLALLPSS